MSGAVLPFSAKTEPRFMRSTHKQRQDAADIRNVLLIREAKREADNWLTIAFLALLQGLDSEQQRSVEARAVAQTINGSREAEQALAVIRLATGPREYRQRIRAMLARMDGGDL